MGTLDQFVRVHGITATCEYASENPNMEHDAWHASASHYVVTLRDSEGDTLDVPFSCGAALTDEPDALVVLDALASDAASVAGRSFEDWADELGYDSDSRKAEATYEACKSQTERLRRWLGSDALLDALMYGTERL